LTFLAAKVGSRVSHVPQMTASSSVAMLGAVLGSFVVGPSGLGGAASASLGKAVGAAKGAALSLADLIPLLPHGVLSAGAAGLSFGQGLIPVPAGPVPIVCSAHAQAGPQLVLQGAATISVGGAPIARVGDTLTCGAVICDGLPTVPLGGPAATTAPPPANGPGLASPLAGVSLARMFSQSGAELSAQLGHALSSASAGVQSVVTEMQGASSKATQALEAAALLGEKTAGGVLSGLFGAKA